MNTRALVWAVIIAMWVWILVFKWLGLL